jgi:hypothetical protein
VGLFIGPISRQNAQHLEDKRNGMKDVAPTDGSVPAPLGQRPFDASSCLSQVSLLNLASVPTNDFTPWKSWKN